MGRKTSHGPFSCPTRFLLAIDLPIDDPHPTVAGGRRLGFGSPLHILRGAALVALTSQGSLPNYLFNRHFPSASSTVPLPTYFPLCRLQPRCIRRHEAIRLPLGPRIRRSVVASLPLGNGVRLSVAHGSTLRRLCCLVIVCSPFVALLPHSRLHVLRALCCPLIPLSCWRPRVAIALRRRRPRVA